MHPLCRRLILPLTLIVAGCTQFPDLDATVPPAAVNAPFPTLVPLEPLLAANAAVVSDPEATTQSLQARVAALRNRARLLQVRPVIDTGTRARLRRALARAPG
ncbi:hypothetical protein [uncultured Tateyamaria sp.]|uniref:hypothetical protein n=1 Tax=Tateyamaria sp. 1078 TaxID=3417464 RepID=UPI00261105DE|nr:hypothetical protein [uncultured Tateyamaria sp.]